MNPIITHIADRDRWSRAGATYARGSAHFDGKLFSGHGLCKLFQEGQDWPRFLSLVKRTYGYFAVIHQMDDVLFAASDHLRSIPLFYGIGSEEFYISDDPSWIITRMAAARVNPASVAEFLFVGCVTGKDTFCSGLDQLQAGEALRVSRNGDDNGFRIKRVRHFEFGYRNPFYDSQDKLLERLDIGVVNAFHRLVEFAHGRPIIVPLGGGTDSRLVVLMLKRLGYDKTIAFSYGRLGNDESEASRKVASELGIQWEFVAYTNESWERWSESQEWKLYLQKANLASSIPHIQDWPAIWELRRQELIPKDAIFTPGHQPVHTGRGLTNFPLAWLKSGTITEEQFLDSIWETFYILHDTRLFGPDLKKELRAKILRLTETKPPYGTDEAIDQYERWWWQETEAKFAINSVRAYEFWGYQWWLPLWDLELAELWSSIPAIHRLRKNEFLTPYVRRMEEKLIGHNIPILSYTSRTLSLASRLLKNTPFRESALKIYGRRQYNRHQFAWYGIIPKKLYNQTFTGTENINSYVALETLHHAYSQDDKLKEIQGCADDLLQKSLYPNSKMRISS